MENAFLWKKLWMKVLITNRFSITYLLYDLSNSFQSTIIISVFKYEKILWRITVGVKIYYDMKKDKCIKKRI